MKKAKSFLIDNPKQFANNLAYLINDLDVGFLLIDNDISQKTDIYKKYHQYDFIAGLKLKNSNKNKEKEHYQPDNKFKEINDWLFGYIGYDYKNQVENLYSRNPDKLGFNEFFFFQPDVVLSCNGNNLIVEFSDCLNEPKIIELLVNACNSISYHIYNRVNGIEFKSKFTKGEYIKTIEAIKNHIQLGDIYEVNICQEFYCEVKIIPADIFTKLCEVSPSPFASFVKHYGKYLICASPERFIKKSNDQLISQPIKGTAKRGTNTVDDQLQKDQLQNDPKERAENIMIVDLVRNDLSKVAEKGTVKVDELCGVYPFSQVFQMISTISCKIPPSTYFQNIIKATFPMGSMTGAPKIRAMQLIEDYEKSKRGLFSGSVGYITPANDFDFNVVIRSLMYNAENSYLSFSVGGAITINSDPEKEYNECILKASAILKTLNATINNAE